MKAYTNPISDIEKELEEASKPAEYIIQAIANCEVRSSDQINVKPPCLELLQEDGSVPIATFGNFGCIIGKAKSRKSFVASYIAAAAASNSTVLNIRANMPHDRSTVLYFDTEQEKEDVTVVSRRISKLCSLKETIHPTNLKVYRFRKYTPKQRREIIEHLIYNTENVGLVIIDGARDLVNSINDEEEATMLTTLFMRWTEERNFYLLTVLHQNKSNGDARGHLGTEIVHKGQSIISVSLCDGDENKSEIKAEFMRKKFFKPYIIGINSQELPYIVDGYVKKTASKARTPEAHDFEIKFHAEYLKSIFWDQKKKDYKRDLSLNKVYPLVAEVFKKNGHSVGQTKAREFVKYYVAKGILTNRGSETQAKYCLSEKIINYKEGDFWGEPC